MAELPAALVAVLESEREALNTRFHVRQRSGSQIDAVAFLEHVRASIVPLAAQVHAAFPERTRPALMELYDVSLDLFAESLLGAEAKIPWVSRVWTELLPLTAKLLARSPRQVSGLLCNAVHHIAGNRGARPEEWLERMRAALPSCESVTEMLAAGKVAAWLAGMVQYRGAALAAAAELPHNTARIVLGLPDSTARQEISTVLDRLQRHPWLTVAEACRGEPKPLLRCAAVAGAFTGFGGLFRRPPLVWVEGDQLLVGDGVSQWQLIADAYGVCFSRVGDGSATIDRTRRNKSIAVDRRGTLRWDNLSLSTPAEGKGRSVPPLDADSALAVVGSTLAVTIPTSHHVFLFSREGSP